MVLAGAFPASPDRMVGGIEAVMTALAGELARRPDVELHVLAVRRDGGPDEVQQRPGMTVHLLRAAARLPFVLRVTELDPARITAALRRIQPDIVHAHAIDAPMLGALRSGIPTVGVIHGIAALEVRILLRTLWDRVRLLQMERLERACLPRLRYLAACSPFVLEEYRALLPRDLVVESLENPVLDPYFDVPDMAETRTALFVGAVTPLKGVDVAVEAFAEVARALPEAQLRIGGTLFDAPFAETLRAAIGSRGLADRVHLLGYLSDEQMLAEYARCQVLVLPSLRETLPVAVQQAMAAGRAVIATRVGGIPGLVDEGRTGYLVDPSAVAPLARALTRVLGDASHAAALGSAARSEAEARFRLRGVVDRTLAFYRRVLAELPRGK